MSDRLRRIRALFRGVAGAIAIGLLGGPVISQYRATAWESRVAGAEVEVATLTDLHCRARVLLGVSAAAVTELASLCAREWTDPGGAESTCDRIAKLGVDIKQQIGQWREYPESRYVSPKIAYATGVLRVHLRKGWLNEGCEPIPALERGYADTIVECVLNGSREFEPSAEALARLPEIPTSASARGADPTD